MIDLEESENGYSSTIVEKHHTGTQAHILLTHVRAIVIKKEKLLVDQIHGSICIYLFMQMVDEISEGGGR